MRTKKDTQRSLYIAGSHDGPTARGAVLAVLHDLVDRLPDDEAMDVFQLKAQQAPPAPLAVDEAEIRDQAREARHRLHEEREFFSWSDQSDAHDAGYVAGYEAAIARLRGAPR